MTKIKINSGSYNKLCNLCDEMKTGKEAKAKKKVAEYLREVYNLCGYLADEYEALSEVADDAYDALLNKNFTVGIDTLSDIVAKTNELQNDIKELSDSVTGSLLALRKLVSPSSWTPIHTDDEVRQAIEEGLSKTDFMTLASQNGKFALLFEVSENDRTQTSPPFIFAYGEEDDIDEIRAYIEQFLDMEEI